MKKRSIVALVAVFAVFAFLAVAGIVLVMPLLSGDRTASFESPGILVVDLDGLVVERAPADFLGAELEGASHELLDLALALDRAIEDDRIGGVYVRLGVPGFGWAKAEEIRGRLDRVREAGKPVYAFTDFTDELGYYVLTPAERIHTLPGALVEMNGFRAETPFIRRLMDKLGIDPQVAAVGAYKTALDVLARENMSDAQREVTESILAERIDRFVETVAEARGSEPERLRSALSAGVYLARDLEALGLADGGLHEHDVQRELLEAVTGREAERDDLADHLVDVRDYAADLPDRRAEPAGTVALVYAVGMITGGESGYDPLFGRTIGARTMTRILDDVAADDEADAIVLRIDSPGGDAFASEEIWAALQEIDDRPVIVSMSDVAASGGYYIAAGADEIVAEPATITGSIGVLAVLFDASEAYEKLGIGWSTVSTGPAATFPTTTRPLTDEERQTFELLVEDTYHTFVDRVAEGRDRSIAEIDAVAQGRVWTGAQAVDRGLVDRLGGLDEALRAARELAGIDPDASVRLHVYPRRQTFLDRLRQALSFRRLDAGLAAGRAEHRIALEVGRGLARSAAVLTVSLAVGPARPLAVIPWIPEIR